MQRKEERKKQREEDIKDAHDNLTHQMLMYNAADCSYHEINASLKRDKGKRKATTATEDEYNENEGSVHQESSDHEDEVCRSSGKRLRENTLTEIEENQSMLWFNIEIIQH